MPWLIMLHGKISKFIVLKQPWDNMQLSEQLTIVMQIHGF